MIYHEIIHIMQFREYGAEYVMNNREYFERLAEQAEESFAEKLKKEGKM